MPRERFRRLEREGGPRLDEEEPLELEARPEPERAPVLEPPPPADRAGLVAPPVDPSSPPADRDEPGFGTVLASGVLVACILALVSIPVRRIFGAGGSAGGDRELATLVLLTLALYWSVRRKLRRL